MFELAIDPSQLNMVCIQFYFKYGKNMCHGMVR